MQIILINPPNPERTGTFRPPVNLAGLASYIKQFGYDTKIFDFEALDILDAGTMAKMIMQAHPDVVGFTCLTPRIANIMETARACKSMDSEVVIILGGAHVSGAPESVLCEPAIDYAIMGEAEEALHELLQALENRAPVSGIANLIFRSAQGGIQVNAVRPFISDLDALPLPAWDLLPLELYKDPLMFHGAYMGISTARGCAWNCNFCASGVIWKRKVRLRSAPNVVAELKLLGQRYGISEFFFYDDTFTIKRERTLEICDLIKQAGLKIRFYVSLRADTVQEDVIMALKEAGCLVCWMGVESGDEEILRLTGKGETKQQMREAARIFKKAGMPFFASYIIGHPGDTHASIKKTIAFALELDSDQAKFLIATPFPGTQLFAQALAKGLIPAVGQQCFREYSFYQHIAANLSLVSDEDLKHYQLMAYEAYDKRKRPLK